MFSSLHSLRGGMATVTAANLFVCLLLVSHHPFPYFTTLPLNGRRRRIIWAFLPGEGGATQRDEVSFSSFGGRRKHDPANGTSLTKTLIKVHFSKYEKNYRNMGTICHIHHSPPLSRKLFSLFLDKSTKSNLSLLIETILAIFSVRRIITEIMRCTFKQGRITENQQVG